MSKILPRLAQSTLTRSLKLLLCGSHLSCGRSLLFVGPSMICYELFNKRVIDLLPRSVYLNLDDFCRIVIFTLSR